MRYHHKKPTIYRTYYGETYICNHPVYSRCTLYLIGDKGLAVIQQKYDPNNKHVWWQELDPWLTDELYLTPGFKEYFEQNADVCANGIYPTIPVRKLMWALKMKPLPKDIWETTFDRARV